MAEVQNAIQIDKNDNDKHRILAFYNENRWTSTAIARTKKPWNRNDTDRREVDSNPRKQHYVFRQDAHDDSNHQKVEQEYGVPV